MQDYVHFMIILLGIRNVSDKSCRENQDIYFKLNYFFLKTVPCIR